MTTETTYTIEQIAEKMFVHGFTVGSTKGFIKFLKPEPPALGWIGYDSHGKMVFITNPDSVDITRYSMREVMFKPEDTE
jgi:hypothetical protein